MAERAWHPPTTEHNYLVKMRAMVDEPTCPILGGEHLDYEADVKHDAWCDALSGNHAGFCNCDPHIAFRPMMTTTRNED